MGQPSSALLRSALGINLALSLTCGLTCMVFGSIIADWVGAIPVWLVTGVGAGLLVFAAGIAWTLIGLRIGKALLVSALDILWVLGTVPLTLIPGLLTADGVALILVLAAIVGTLGGLQLTGIRAMLSTGVEHSQYRHCIRVRSSADPEKLWRVVRDLGGIARYSAGLSASRLDGRDPAPGTVRVCTNTRGESWAEEVASLDDSDRSVFFRFRSEAEDFPFPMAGLSGGWHVSAYAQGSSLVDVWWIVTPKQRRLGWLVVALMTIPLDRDLPEIVGAMEADAMKQAATAKPRRLALGYC